MARLHRRFEPVSHTADLGLDVYGSSMPELFENAALGMFSLITDASKLQEKLLLSISIDAYDKEELLVTFLNELLYYYATKRVLFKRFEIARLTDTHLDVSVSGEELADTSGYEIMHDVKSATYHDLKIAKTSAGAYKTRIIFDV
jgi:SHS2 domain-containing protein